jgi:hypothetical protein
MRFLCFVTSYNVIMLINMCNNAMEQLQNWKVKVSSDSLSSCEVVTTFIRYFSASENNFSLQSIGKVYYVVTVKCMKMDEELLLTIRDSMHEANEKLQQEA